MLGFQQPVVHVTIYVGVLSLNGKCIITKQDKAKQLKPFNLLLIITVFYYKSGQIHKLLEFHRFQPNLCYFLSLIGIFVRLQR